MNIEIYGGEISHNTALVLPNRFVGVHEDELGERGRLLSDAVKKPVIAYERPGTGSNPAEGVYTEESLLDDMEYRAEVIGNIAADAGYSRLMTTGYSAAGAEALLLADTKVNKLPISHVFAFDPVMMNTEEMSGDAREAWLRDFATILKNKALRRPDDIEYFKDVDPGKAMWPKFGTFALASAKRLIREIKSYQEVYFSDLALNALRNIADNGDVKAYLAIGTESGIMDHQAVAAEFKDSETTVIEVIPGANHDFAEWSGYFNHLVQKGLEQSTS